jgi:hypothetical protein
MQIDNLRWLLLLMSIVVYQNSFCIGEKYRVYTEPSGRLCFWQGNAPFCFIGSGCPTRTTNMKIDKSGDGAFCWIGHKFYCCV